MVHYPTEYPGPQTDSRLSTIGKISYLQILGTKLTCSKEVKKLSIRQRQCLYPDEYRLKYFGNTYNDANCLLECEENFYFNMCGCVPFYFSFSGKGITGKKSFCSCLVYSIFPFLYYNDCSTHFYENS